VPSLSPGFWTRKFGQKDGLFYASALSVIAADLPSKKSPKPAGTVLECGKACLDCFSRRSGTEMNAGLPLTVALLSPEIYSLSGLVNAVIS
jgi:hypothetical protein